jgi:hypothetical protein
VTDDIAVRLAAAGLDDMILKDAEELSLIGDLGVENLGGLLRAGAAFVKSWACRLALSLRALGFAMQLFWSRLAGFALTTLGTLLAGAALGFGGLARMICART